MTLNAADALYSGADAVDALYSGSDLIWQPGGGGGGYDFGGTPFAAPTFNTGREVYATASVVTTPKGEGIEVNNSQYLQGYVTTVVSNGPQIDFQQPWGFQFWINFHNQGNQDVHHYAMVTNYSTTRNSTADRKWWMLYLDQKTDGAGNVGVQHGSTLGGEPTTQSIGSLGLLTRDTWYLVSMDVGGVSGNAWSDIYVRADDLAGDVREITYPGPINLLTAIQSLVPGIGLQAGVPMYAEPSITWVPVAWKGTTV